MVKLQRLGCLRSPLIVARDYTKYDEHAVAQIKRTIELGRFRKYGDEFMVLELVNEITSTAEAEVTSSAQRGEAMPSPSTWHNHRTTDLEVTLASMSDLERAKNLLITSDETS